MRILLFILPNMAVVLVMGVVWRLLGFESILDNQGIDLDFNALLVFCALFGMGIALFAFHFKVVSETWDAHTHHRNAQQS